MDFWFAECLPCKWEKRIPYTGAAGEQDLAIAAAEEHVTEAHPRVKPFDRAKAYMGHVQLRTESALPPPLDPTPRPTPPSVPTKEFILSTASVEELRNELAARGADEPKPDAPKRARRK